MTKREVLTAPRTYYINPAGNDCDNGLTASTPFRTAQRAVDVIANTLDLAGFDVTVSLAVGSYNGFIARRCVGDGTVIIQGDVSDPTSRLFDGPPSNAVPPGGFARTALVWGLNTGCTYRFGGVKFELDDHMCLWALGCTTFMWGNVVFGQISTEDHIRIYGGALGKAYAPYGIDGDAFRHLITDLGGHAEIESQSITLMGTPNFGGAFVRAMQASSIAAKGMTFTGSATGRKFQVIGNSIIDTSGADKLTYFPGSVAGVEATGGLWV